MRNFFKLKKKKNSQSLNRHYYRENIPNKLGNISLLVVRKMQSKNTVQQYFMPTRKSKIKNSENSK